MNRYRNLVRSLQNPNYRTYLISQFISQTGSWMQSIALSWLVYRVSKSPALLGLVSFTEMLPAVLLGPIAGVLCDRVPLRRIILATQSAYLLQAAALAVVALQPEAQLWQVFALAIVSGVINAIDIPARGTFVAELVKPSELPNCLALNSSVYNAARIIGPAVAGIMVASIGESACFAFNAVTYIPVILALRFMKLHPRPIQPHRSWFASMAEALEVIRNNGRVLKTMTMFFATCFFGYTYIVLLPVFSSKVFNGDARLLGLATSSIGIGAVIGSLVLASREGTQGFVRLVIASSTGFNLLTLCFGLSQNLSLSLALLPVIGFFMVNQATGASSLVQMEVDPRVRGRILAVYSLAHTCAAPMGALAAGRIAEVIGAPSTVVMTSIAGLLVALWYANSMRKEVRRDTTLREDTAKIQTVS